LGKRIVVIEDEPAIAENIVYALTTEGFEPVWCPTCRAGLAALTDGGAELVVLDVMLPDGNGFDLCREIRRTSRVPVIFLTARAGEIDRVVGLELGGDDYVVKPFSPRELTARIKAVLRRSRREPAAAGTSSAAASSGAGPGNMPFEVDETRFVISFRGRPLDLSRYEFRLLRILVSRPGWVFTRARLMEMAWEDPGTILERTVDAHIKSVRAKLKAVDPEAEPIRTHRGTGYSLRDDW
jgi:two-component system catabolic regulation response regulator CreB